MLCSSKEDEAERALSKMIPDSRPKVALQASAREEHRGTWVVLQIRQELNSSYRLSIPH